MEVILKWNIHRIQVLCQISVFSSDLIYQPQSTSACKHTKYKDFHGYLETSASDDSDTDDFTGFNFNWKTDNLHKRKRNKYNGIGGSKFNHPDEAQPQHYFELFWDSNVWAKLVIELTSTPNRNV